MIPRNTQFNGIASHNIEKHVLENETYNVPEHKEHEDSTK